MPIIEIAKIQVRRGSELGSGNGVPQLAPGELAWAVDTQNLYIGKRRFEADSNGNPVSTGASDDNNTRILTEKDLSSILASAVQNVAVTNLNTSSYRFKNYLQYGLGTTGQTTATSLATTGSVYTKLDNFVSITDFTPVWPPASNDITLALQNAIGMISPTNLEGGVIISQHGGADAYNGTTPVVPSLGPFTIKIPPGQWTLNATVYLPPYTTLEGEGAGKTVLTTTVNDYGFQTVDGLGNTLGSQHINTGLAPGFVKLKGMTIQPQVGNPNHSLTLLSLDDAKNVTIEDVYFGNPSSTFADTTNTNVVGVLLRSTATVRDITLVPLQNININNCMFYGISTAVVTTGTVNKLSITQTKFDTLEHGIISQTQSQFANSYVGLGNINATLTGNMFENIGAEAMIIGSANNPLQSYVSSSFNSFINVGNNFRSDTTQTNSIITANDTGFRSYHDYFDRIVNAPNLVYQFPWVSGNSILRTGTTFNKTIFSNNTTNLLKVPLTDNQQVVTLDYVVDNRKHVAFGQDFTRQGRLTMNIDPSGNVVSPDGFASVGDEYHFSEATLGDAAGLVFTTDLSRSQPGIFVQGGFDYNWGYTQGSVVPGNTALQLTLQHGSTSSWRTGFTQVSVDPDNLSIPPFYYSTGSSVQHTGFSYTATLAAPAALNTLTNILTVVIDTGTSATIPTTTPVAIWNSLQQWVTTTYNTYVLPINAPLPSVAVDNDISIIPQTSSSYTYYTTSTIQPYIMNYTLNGTWTNSGASIDYLVTNNILSRVTTSTFSATDGTYALNFNYNAHTALTIQPFDIIGVLVINNQFQNYVSLTCISTGISNSDIEFDLTLMN